MSERSNARIAPGQWGGLNAQYYNRESGPHDYIRVRLDALRDMDSAATGDARLIEAVNLLSYASEALLRQFLAHRGAPQCPWFELSQLRDSSAFKCQVAAVRDETSEGVLSDDDVAVFCGPLTGRTASAKAAVDRARTGLTALINIAANIVIDEAGAYNAIKHGGAAIPRTGAAAAEFASMPVEPRGRGDSIVALRRANDGEQTRWSRVLTFVDVEQKVALVTLVIEQLENLWSVARFRYLDVPLARLHPVTEDMSMRARYAGGADGPAVVTEIVLTLGYIE